MDLTKLIQLLFSKFCILLCRNSDPDVFCKKGVFGNFTKFTRKHLGQSLFFNKNAGLRQSLFFNKNAGLRPAILLKKRLWHRC